MFSQRIWRIAGYLSERGTSTACSSPRRLFSRRSRGGDTLRCQRTRTFRLALCTCNSTLRNTARPDISRSSSARDTSTACTPKGCSFFHTILQTCTFLPWRTRTFVPSLCTVDNTYRNSVRRQTQGPYRELDTTRPYTPKALSHRRINLFVSIASRFRLCETRIVRLSSSSGNDTVRNTVARRTAGASTGLNTSTC